MSAPFHRGISDELKVALASFGLLALELASIRWLAGQVRIFAYLNNLVLISAFLGMGLGVALSGRRPGLERWVLPAFFLFVALVTLGDRWLADLAFPDASVHLWGGETDAALLTGAVSLVAVLTLLAMVVGCFLLQGAAVGHYFRRLPPLRAYSCDLGGALLGVIAYTFTAASGAPPAVWFLVGGLPFLIIARSVWSAAALVGVVALGWVPSADALYSPYNRIEIIPRVDRDIEIHVNHDFHQILHNLSQPRIDSASGAERERRAWTRQVYDLPYTMVQERDRALIVGAGTGNDARAALRGQFDTVYAVDIDPLILTIGREMHPEAPYSDPRVIRIADDARAFLQRYDGPPFDIVSYGFLDSHAMFSAMSSLRLENYVYSEEGLRAAWEHVAEGGVLSVAFSVLAGPWIQDRLYWTLAKATGRPPTIVEHQLYQGSTFLVSKDPAVQLAPPGYAIGEPRAGVDEVMTTSDDWPFLYLRPGTFPWAYVVILTCLLGLAAVLVRRVFGAAVTGDAFDAPMFFFGAAFLLLETRGITTLSLLFGSTWLVNAAVFGGILLTALAANLYVQARPPKRYEPWFMMLFLALGLLWLIEPGQLAGLPMLLRGVVGGALIGLPVGFAGIIVSARIARSPDPAAAFGSNLLGAVLGGCLEYFSMLIGLQSLLLLAAALYALGLIWMQRGSRVALAPPDGRLTVGFGGQRAGVAARHSGRGSANAYRTR